MVLGKALSLPHTHPLSSPEAEVVLSKAVKLRPDLVEAWNELGESYMMKQVQIHTNIYTREVHSEAGLVHGQDLLRGRPAAQEEQGGAVSCSLRAPAP